VLFVPLWASGFILGKIATGHMQVPTVLLWRFVVALVVMGAVVAVTRPSRPRGSAWLHLAVTALLLQVGQFSFVYSGLAHGVPAGLSSLILGMAPLLGQAAMELTVAGRKRLELARALATNPQLLLLDEVMAGLNPSEIVEMVGIVRTIRDLGVTVLLIEHVMQAVMSLSENIYVLSHGRVIAQGAPRDVVADPAVIEAYLGRGAAAIHGGGTHA
jgi:hypothetical protein